MRHIDDLVRDNAGRMSRDELATSLRGAGYGDKEIQRAISHVPPADEPSWAGFEHLTAEVGAAASYVSTNRGRFQREQLTAQLRAAGYGEDVIRAGWIESDRQLAVVRHTGGRDLFDVLLDLRGWIGVAIVVGAVLLWIARFTVAGFPVGLVFLVLVPVGAILAWRFLRRAE
jgi:hypothetical protein